MVQRSFRIHEPVVQMSMKQMKVVSKDMKTVTDYYPTMQISLKGERCWRPYLWQIILMMMLMSTSSLFIFALKQDDAGDRLGAITTMFLTKVAFQFALTTMLPRLSYLTVLDKYIFSCMVFSFSIMLQVAIISWLPSNDIIEVPAFVDRIILLINFVILIVGNFCFSLYIYIRVLPKEKQKLLSFENSITCQNDSSI